MQAASGFGGRGYLNATQVNQAPASYVRTSFAQLVPGNILKVVQVFQPLLPLLLLNYGINTTAKSK
jgi:hypothetical protein